MGHAIDHQRPRLEFARDALAIAEFEFNFVLPRRNVIDPGLNGVVVKPLLLNRERAAPAIIVRRGHGVFVPNRAGVMFGQEPDGQKIMPIGKNGGFDRDRVARNSFNRRVPRPNQAWGKFRGYVLDHHAGLSIERKFYGGRIGFRSAGRSFTGCRLGGCCLFIIRCAGLDGASIAKTG